MNVIIMNEGNKNIGFGHVTRCISLYQAFEENNIKPLILINGDETIRYLLNGVNYKIVNWVEKLKELLNKYIVNADVLIIDSYLANYELYKRVSRFIKIPVYIDDNKRIDYPKGIVVNGTIYAEELNYPQKKNVTYFLGSQYMPLRREFWDIPENSIKENIENVMITFGGDDSVNITPTILECIVNNSPKITKKVIIGKGFTKMNINEIKRVRDSKTSLIYYPDAKEIKNIMFESDVAISACGQTLYELARIGVPTIGIGVAYNQVNNIRGWLKAGFIEYAGWWKDNNLIEKILKCYERLEDKKVRMEKSLIGRKFVDGQGSQRIINKLLQMGV